MTPRLAGRMLQAVILAGTMAWAIQACSAGVTPDNATAVTSSSGVSSTGTTGSTGSEGFGSTVVPGGGPPPEAVAACTGRSEGSSCTFTAPSGEVSGTCHAGRDGSGSLACTPAGHPGDGGPGKPPDGGQGPHGGPPPEAVAACTSRTEGASCSFTAPSGELSGTCHAGGDGSGSLACMPAGHPGDGGPGKPPDGGQGPHGGPPQAVAACTTLASGATCSFTAPFGNVSGTCRTGPNGGTLVCSPTGGGPR